MEKNGVEKMKSIGIIVALCTIIATLSFDVMLIVDSASRSTPPKQMSSFSPVEITGNLSQKALKDCYIIPGKGPPV
ncbi:MAG: hypothetical protein WC938_01790 [Candidatus Paceibacterota bacterium]